MGPDFMMPPRAARAAWLRRIRRVALVLGPCLAFGVWLAVARGDRMAPHSSRINLPSVVCEEFGLSAMALRGSNANLGRQAGAAENPKGHGADFSNYLSRKHELAPRYFLEYPHAALLLFRAGYWIQPGWRDVPLPSGLPDCDYHNIASHYPKTEQEFRFLRLFVVASRFYVGVMFV